MSETKIRKILSNEDFLKKLESVAGMQIDKDQIAMCFYSIMLDEEDNAESFISGQILVDGVPYSQSMHGDLLSLAKRYLRTPNAFEFDDSFVDTIYDRGI